ncbi:MAG: type II secretion system F family protein [Geminicoccaceae bacterium]|nr:type II secretion system F family protein [Geminicoccaceae bacterium]MCB2009096.1 type II secretion system F family protein [Geminicoccaceae bacterium]
MDQDLIFFIAIGVGSFSVAWIALSLVTGGGAASSGQMNKRIGRIADRANGIEQQSGGAETARAFVRDRNRGLSSIPLLGSFIPKADQLQKKFDRAGLSWTVKDGIVIWAIMAVILTGVIIYFLGLGPFLAIPSGATGSLMLLSFYIKRKTQKRVTAFVGLFPNAIELIVRSVKSGLPVTEAMAAIGTEIDEPVGSVFTEISNNIQIGMELPDALWSASAKLDIQEFKFFAISLSIQQETGGNISEILQNLSSMIRRREQVKLKIKAMSSEAKASAMIIGSLPFIMSLLIYLVNRDYIMVLFTDQRGWVALGIAAGMMSTGIFVITKMIRFEI